MAVEDNADVQFLTQKSSKWLENPPIYNSGKQRKRVRTKRPGSSKQRSKKLYLLMRILLGIFLVGAILSLLAYPRYADMYHRDAALAQTGVAHLRMAVTLLTSLAANPLDSQAVQFCIIK